jgi:hypothetical protein
MLYVSSARAARNSRSFGGKRLTSAGTSRSLARRRPQPVSRTIGVVGEAARIAAATLRPSTFGIPRSVNTIANGSVAEEPALKADLWKFLRQELRRALIPSGHYTIVQGAAPPRAGRRFFGDSSMRRTTYQRGRLKDTLVPSCRRLSAQTRPP